jgi:DNA-directed RNA polymerase specialized sigma24 family protein
MIDFHLALDKFLKSIGAYSFVSDEDIELAAMYRRLPREEQDILRWVYNEDLPIKEAAERMGLETREAQALLDRACERLRSFERSKTLVAHPNESK